MSPHPVQPTFILTVKVQVAPENVQTMVKHFRTAYDKVIAEPECVYFLVGQKHDEPGFFQWTEGWAKPVEWFMKVSCFHYCNLLDEADALVVL